MSPCLKMEITFASFQISVYMAFDKNIIIKIIYILKGNTADSSHVWRYSFGAQPCWDLTE